MSNLKAIVQSEEFASIDKAAIALGLVLGVPGVVSARAYCLANTLFFTYEGHETCSKVLHKLEEAGIEMFV